MPYPFDIAKATDVVCQFLRRDGGTMNIMKMIKLVYLLDRLSIKRRGIPVVGGIYFSLRNGPITSELLDLINSGLLQGSGDDRWARLIGDRQNHEISLMGNAPDEHLSQSEIALVDELFNEHGQRDQWSLRDWTHEHCSEWTPLDIGRNKIELEAIARALGKSESEISRIKEDADEAFFVHEALGN